MEYNPDIYHAVGIGNETRDGDVLIYPGGRREEALSGYRITGKEEFTVVRLNKLPVHQHPAIAAIDRHVASLPSLGSGYGTGGSSNVPTDASTRKGLPLVTGVLKYFPLALLAVAMTSQKGNDQHNPGKPLHWDRSKSGDELDALGRHLAESGTRDTDGIRHSAKVAWRALANLQKEIEADGGAL